MALNISPSVMNAFQKKAEKAEITDFVAWWNLRKNILGTLSSDAAEALLHEAYEDGGAVGIDDNYENRAYLMAALLRLLPSPTPRTLILALDAIFAPASDDERFQTLVTLAKSEA